jgi:endonuclease/exonuclease/phosphatase family metal-dependent hydrolase
MSFNIRCDILNTDIKDNDYWPSRCDIVSQMLREARPHILGVQELMAHQRNAILAGLDNGYMYVGEPRDDSIYSERCAIFYNPAYLHLINSGTFWLSDTPLVKGSITWENKDPRIVTWAQFLHKQTHRYFTVANTHFDHISELSRQLSAKMLLQYFDSSETIIMGDFNSPLESSLTYSILTEKFNDTLSIGIPQGPLYGTWNNYGEPVENGERLDWILASKDLQVDKVKVNTFTVNGKYPSDHLPVEAVLIFD